MIFDLAVSKIKFNSNKNIINYIDMKLCRYRFNKRLKEMEDEQLDLELIDDFFGLSVVFDHNIMYNDKHDYSIECKFSSHSNSKTIILNVTNSDQSELQFKIYMLLKSNTHYIPIDIEIRSEKLNMDFQYYNNKQVWGLEKLYLDSLKEYMIEFIKFILR